MSNGVVIEAHILCGDHPSAAEVQRELETFLEMKGWAVLRLFWRGEEPDDRDDDYWVMREADA